MLDDVRSRALEEAAKIADFYAVENFRLATDTVLTDPVLSRRDISEAACEVSMRLADEGEMHASRAHAARDIAQAIRRLAAGH